MTDFPTLGDLLIDYGVNFSKIISLEGRFYRRSKEWPYELLAEVFNL